MYYNSYYWYWENAFDDKWINKVHKLAKKEGIRQGTVGTEKRVDSEMRASNICFLDQRWMHDSFRPYIDKANKSAGWNFEWYRSEPIQYTEYKLNQFYNYHADTFPIPTKTGTQRKLSAVISLNDSSEYEGGEFKIMTNPLNIIEVPALKKKGTIIVFPSTIWHKVEPITKGKRYSLVVWCEGFDFR
jgi:PKHD-type hydroxylase|tara:strand:+ start:653 stop:1213 length:561 start_codon:yes stop_codon:yes gene_type:complete